MFAKQGAVSLDLNRVFFVGESHDNEIDQLYSVYLNPVFVLRRSDDARMDRYTIYIYILHI